MLLLDAVNLILPALGEHQVTSLDVKHPTLAIILPQIEQQRKDTMNQGWWFNNSPARLLPDSEGYIDVPIDTLSFIPANMEVAVRGERFYDLVNRTFKFSGALEGDLISDLTFEELPESAAYHVFYSSLVLCYATDIGLEQTVQLWSGKASKSLADMEREHLRNRKYSNARSRRYRRRLRAMRG